jgi:hypothetical protein
MIASDAGCDRIAQWQAAIDRQQFIIDQLSSIVSSPTAKPRERTSASRCIMSAQRLQAEIRQKMQRHATSMTIAAARLRLIGPDASTNASIQSPLVASDATDRDRTAITGDDVRSLGHDQP